MKALIVCEDDDVIAKITEATTASGYDNIVYRRAMKALDNVEEISPDVVIFNACDYPRHWKPFISYSRAFLKKMPEVILYVPKYFSDAEKKKADALFVKGIFSNTNADGIYKLKTLISIKKEHNSALYGVKILRDPRKENKAETNSLNTVFFNQTNSKTNLLDKKTDSNGIDFFNTKYDNSNKKDNSPILNWFDKKIDDDPEIDFFNTKANEKTKTARENKKRSNTMMFTHPYSGAFVTGTIKSISDDETQIDFSPDVKIQRLSAGDNINSLSLNTMHGIRSCRAIIERIDDGLITLKVA